MKWLRNKFTLWLGLGIVLGLILFFPVHRLKYPLINLANKQGINLDMTHVGLWTGLGLGLSQGSLFALDARNVELSPRNGATVECTRLLIAPHLFPLLLGKIKLGFLCELPIPTNSIGGAAVVSPFWGPKTADIEIELNNIDLSPYSSFLPGISLSGIVSGQVIVEDLSLLRNASLPKTIDWNLVAREVKIPPVQNDFVKLPELPLGPLSSNGSIKDSKLDISSFKFGDGSSPLEGDWKIQFGLSRSMMPISGDWTGFLRVDPDFESLQIGKSINLSTLFGPADDSGRREFTKELSGSLISLMRPPTNK